MGGGGLGEERFEVTLAAAREGDEWALAALWRTYQPRLRGYLGALDPAADDVCSETWLAVARSLGRFQGGESDFRSWLYTIAHRRLADHRRAALRRPTVGLGPSGEGDEGTASAEAAAVERDATRRALDLIASLPADQAQVVLLRTVAGLPATDVARIVGKRPGAVRVLAHRGLRNLARTLGTPRVTDAEVELDGARNAPGPAGDSWS